MHDLIKALHIFMKYIPNETHPTSCGHDELYVNCSAELVSDDDIVLLDNLGFFPDESGDGFHSFKYGSC